MSSSSTIIWLFLFAGLPPAAVTSSVANLPFETPGEAIPPDNMRLAVWIIGPLNADLFRRAKTRLEEGEYSNGAGTPSLNVDFIPPPVSLISESPLPGPLTYRIWLGKREEAPGVVGRTLTDECGDLAIRAVGVDTVSLLLDETDEAFE